MSRIDTDDALAGDGALDRLRRAFEAPEHRSAEEREALEHWFRTVAAADVVPPTQAAIRYERDLLGALLNDPDALDEAAGIVRPDDFGQREVGAVFASLLVLADAGMPRDATTVQEHVAQHAKFPAPWGDVIATCRGAHDPASSVQDKAQAVRTEAQRRRLQATAAAIYRRAAGAPAHEAGTILGDASTRLMELEQDAPRGRRKVGVGSAARESFKSFGRRYEALRNGEDPMPGWSTGYEDLDRAFGGWEPGEFYVVLGFRGLGKTTFGLNLGVRTAKRKVIRVLGPSLEMPPEQLGGRCLVAEAQMDAQQYRFGMAHDGELVRLTDATKRLLDLDAWYNLLDSPGLSVEELCRIVRCERRDTTQPPLGLVIVDYLQLLGTEAKHDSRRLAVDGAALALKQLATRERIAVLALSQVNADGRSAESSGPENHASTVMRLELQDPEAAKGKNNVIVLVRFTKNRHGVDGAVVPMRFRRDFQEFKQIPKPGEF